MLIKIIRTPTAINEGSRLNEATSKNAIAMVREPMLINDCLFMFTPPFKSMFIDILIIGGFINKANIYF